MKNYTVLIFCSLFLITFTACKKPTDPPIPTKVNIAAIQGVTVPVAGRTPVTAITENTQYTGSVTWSNNPATFAPLVQYTATITLTTKEGFTLQGVVADFFLVEGAITVSNNVNSGVITVIFPTTGPINIGSVVISVTSPVKDAMPDTTASGMGNFTISPVSWSPTDSPFLGNTAYKATVLLTANSGYTFTGLNSATINAENATISDNTGATITLSYTFPETDQTNIDIVTLSITPPVFKTTPDTIASGTGNFTLSPVSWLPNDNPFLSNTAYKATVILTANSGYTFTGLNSATINGENATISDNTGANVTLSYSFPATDAKTVTNIEIKAQPTKLTYTHGESLDLSGLVVMLTYDDTTTEDVAVANFTAKNIIANPARGVSLIHVTHNEQPVTIKYGNFTPLTTSNLTVNKAVGIWSSIPAINTTYTPTLTLTDITLPSGYTFTTPATKLNAGNNQSFAATYTNPNGNFEAGSGSIIVNVAKSGPASWPTAATITYGSVLSSSLLSGGDTVAGSFTWTNGTIFPTVTNTGYSVTFTPFDTANYNTMTGTIPITVNKAAGELVDTPTLSGYAHNGILINTASPTATGQSAEYGISTSNNANNAEWQTGMAFGGLNAGTLYYIFARSVENDNYNTGTASSSLQVTTRSSNVYTVTTTTEWNNVLALISAFGNGTSELPQTYTITVNGNISVSGSTSASFGTASNVAVTLNGNGGLSLNSNGSILDINQNQTLIIDSASLTLQGRSANTSSLIYSSGTLELRNGIIRDNIVSRNVGSIHTNLFSYGGGVYISSNGTFTMTGGTISNNSAITGSTYAEYSFSYGGGVYVSSNGTFTMTGGTISNNRVDAGSSSSSSSSYGGGVYATNFTMEGGTISNNTSSSGGGVYATAFTMKGGTISNNTTSVSSSSSNPRSSGGGVYATTLTIEEGIISGNTATDGGGVRATTFNMTGGTIKSNKASSNGGGVYVLDNDLAFIKTGGIIYGNDATVTDRNSVTGTSAYGHAVYYNRSPGFYHDTTLNVSDDLYSTVLLPANSGTTLNGWTRR